MLTVGQQLTAPEAGWKRYDDNHETIRYETGKWSNYTSGSGEYNGRSMGASKGKTATAEFDFIGSNLAIITYRAPSYSSNIAVYIDNIHSGILECRGPGQAQTLAFLTTGLAFKRHKVRIEVTSTASNADTYNVRLDAIDINADGRLLHPDEVLTPQELKVGKRIRCHYQATTNAVGIFSNLGVEKYVNGISDFIPVTTTSTPNGSFYFIMVEDWNGKKRLIADRIIQNSISWDTLNTIGITTGVNLGFVENPSLTNRGTAISSPFTNGRGAEEFFAGTTWWETNSSNVKDVAYIGYDFGKECEINLIQLNQGVQMCSISLLDVQVWDSIGSTWRTLKTVSVLGANTLNVIYLNAKTSKFRLLAKSTTNTSNQPWTLNSLKVFTTEDSDFEYTTRLMTGGTSATDKDNEWDKYIVNSTLDGTITAGDNSVWNGFSGSRTLTSTSSINAVNRVLRGGTLSGEKVSNWVEDVSSSKISARGFRPVLEVESLIRSKYLIDDNGTLKSYIKGAWVSAGTHSATPDIFEAYGMDSFSEIDDTAIQQLTSNTPKVLTYVNKPTAALKINYTPHPQTIVANQDVDISLVETITSALAVSKGVSSVFKLLVSVDQGTTWEVFNSNLWERVGLNEISTKGFDVETYNNLTKDDWKQLIDGEDYLRFAYYMDSFDSRTVKAEGHVAMLDMRGAWKGAVNGFDYEYDYPREDRLRVYLYKDGNYKINY